MRLDVLHQRNQDRLRQEEIKDAEPKVLMLTRDEGEEKIEKG